MSTFTKNPREPKAGLAEAAGLRWLGEASDAVVKVVDAGEQFITTSKVHQTAPTPEAARKAGQELARIHLAGAPAFGSPPAGWDGPNYIGTQAQDCTPTDNWAEFYVQQRVMGFVQEAGRRGNMDRQGIATVERACQAILDHYDNTAEPARIHGDLWAGNLMFGEDGPAFIDPAAHGGHPETDLAMLALFGAPHLDQIRAGYEEINPLAPGWVERTPIHQLHPLAVHAVTHGPGYAAELVRAASDTLAILR